MYFLWWANHDSFFDVKKDSGGSGYAVGHSYSSNFPNTTGFYQSANGNVGSADAVVVNFDLFGSPWATYYGGLGHDEAFSIAIDEGHHHSYVTGWTQSTNFPTSVTPYGGGPSDLFVFAIGYGGFSRFYGTTFGSSSGTEIGQDICIDPLSNVYVVGEGWNGGLTLPLYQVLPTTPQDKELFLNYPRQVHFCGLLLLVDRQQLLKSPAVSWTILIIST